MILAEKIMMLRKKNGWSQEELAMKLNISRQSISKWESMNSVPDLDKILKLSQIFGVSTDYLLKDEIEEEPGVIEDVYEEEKIKRVSMEEANHFLELTKKSAKKVAAAVALCILSPAPLIALGGISETYPSVMTEDMAGGLGMVLLLFMITAAVAVFILHGMKMNKYEYLEKEPFLLEYGVEGMVEKKSSEFEETHRTFMVTGTICCILSVIPIFIAAAFRAPELIVIFCVDLLLISVAAGVYQFVWAESICESYKKLLQEEEYTVEKKRQEKRNSSITGIYWCIVTAIYLGVSFYTMQWHRSWIIWPVAAVLFAALCGVLKLIYKKE